jgi:energy-coupling factor transport system permease protein
MPDAAEVDFAHCFRHLWRERISTMHTDPLSQHFHGDQDSFLRSLDPRAKLIMVAFVMVFGFFATSLLFSVLVCLLLVAGIVSSGISAHRLWLAAKSILILAGITFLFHLLFSNSPDAAGRGVYYALRLVLFVLAALFLTMTTSPVDLAEGVVKLARPLRRLRVPVDDIGLILSLAFRFIPILRDELVSVRRAQTLRGVSFSGKFVQRIRMTVPLLVPVFISAVNRADTIALAIEARGYSHNRGRTYFSRMSFQMAEWVFVASGVLTLLIIFLLDRQS